MRRLLILGPPGTGKTTRLLAEMEAHLTAGLAPENIAFVSFTRAAVREARGRVTERFGLERERLPFFRTIHSLCFYQLALRRSDVFGREGLAQLQELTGEELTGKIELDAPTIGERGDALLFLDQLARNALISLDEAWHVHGAPIDWHRLRRFVSAYDGLRRDLGAIDFTDMLERYAGDGAAAPVELAIVDEAQDLTPLQWRVVERAFSGAEELIVAGDDDQTLYHWAGASARNLLEFDGEKEVLSQSYRLPRAVWELAGEISGQISRRYEKRFDPARNQDGSLREGSVEWIVSPDEVDLTRGRWLLLARTRRQLVGLSELARMQGVVYSTLGHGSVDPAHLDAIREHETARRARPELPIWHDALTRIPLDTREYLLTCLRNDPRALTDPPRVRISTIHGAKGTEADNVLLMTDLNARVRRGMELDPDSELRVLYVGVTRAIENLYIVATQSGERGYFS